MQLAQKREYPMMATYMRNKIEYVIGNDIELFTPLVLRIVFTQSLRAYHTFTQGPYPKQVEKAMRKHLGAQQKVHKMRYLCEDEDPDAMELEGEFWCRGLLG